MSLPLYLSLKEIWHMRGRFLLFSLVIALIAVLVLFITALGAGLAKANRQFLQELEADLIIFQENSDFLISGSRIAESKMKEIRRLEGIADLGLLGFSNATLLLRGEIGSLDVTLVGAQPGRPGEPPLITGRSFRSNRSREAIIDKKVAVLLGLSPGDAFILKSVQGTESEFFDLVVAGISEERQFLYQNSVVVPFKTWEDIRPKAESGDRSLELVGNVIAVRLKDVGARDHVVDLLQLRVDGIEVADKATAIRALPGYTTQQSVLDTQRIFTLLIGVLVVGGFFQIQTLQKVGQIGMLKAIGTTDQAVVSAGISQIILVTLSGVVLGALITMLLVMGLPPQVPFLFTSSTIALSLLLLLIIGPVGGLLSIRVATRVEPLRALGL